jgi:hypothetical protein
MVIMTDGVANHCLPGASCGEEAAAAEAIEQATTAFGEDISLFTIAFGLNDPQGVELLKTIACIDDCDNFGWGNTPEEIKEIYRKFAEAIAKKQTVIARRVQGSPQEVFTASKLFGDSYVEISPAPQAESSVRLRVSKTLRCDDSFDLPSNMEVSDCSLSSVAGKYWTDRIELNGQTIYDMQDYGQLSYFGIGDPSVLGLPLDRLLLRNTLKSWGGDVGAPYTECLVNNTVHYTANLPPGLLSGGFRSADGCHWTIDTPAGTIERTIPPSYVGDHECEFRQEGVKYTETDLYEFAAAQLLTGLDSEGDGVIDDAFDEAQVLGSLT